MRKKRIFFQYRQANCFMKIVVGSVVGVSEKKP